MGLTWWNSGENEVLSIFVNVQQEFIKLHNAIKAGILTASWGWDVGKPLGMHCTHFMCSNTFSGAVCYIVLDWLCLNERLRSGA